MAKYEWLKAVDGDVEKMSLEEFAKSGEFSVPK